MKEHIQDKLRDMAADCGGRLLCNRPMSAFTTVGIGGTVPAVYMAYDAVSLRQFISGLDKENLNWIVLGAGSNTLFPDGSVDMVVIKLAGKFAHGIEIGQGRVAAGAGVKLARLVGLCCSYGYRGLEGLAGIPGTVGGAVFCNASYRTSISEALTSVEVLDTRSGSIISADAELLAGGYRRSGLSRYQIVLKACFPVRKTSSRKTRARQKELVEEKKAKQPIGARSLGCVFKNTDSISAGELIEKAGLKGFRHGDAAVSDEHANFIINTGKATCSDYLEVMRAVERKVNEDFDITLEPEIHIVGGRTAGRQKEKVHEG